MSHFDYRIDIHNIFERESRSVCHSVAVLLHLIVGVTLTIELTFKADSRGNLVLFVIQ